MQAQIAANVAPVRERGLKLIALKRSKNTLIVAPVRERGLKFFFKEFKIIIGKSLP